MEKDSLIQPIGQEGTYLRAGWKMIPLFALCLLQDISALKGPRLVDGDPGGTVTIECHYTPSPVNKYQRKYWCRLYPPQRVCHTIISSNFFINHLYQGRATLVDFPSQGRFVVTLTQLIPEDSGYYRCGIGPRTDMLFFSMNLTISTANHSLDSAIITIPSSITPMTTLATRGQTMETLGTSTSVIGRHVLDTSLVVKKWEARTSREDTTPAEVTQASGTTRATTTVADGQNLDTTLLVEGWEAKTSRRDTTPIEVTQAPGTIGVTTIVTDRQDLNTTVFAEGYETRTRRDASSAEVTQIPGAIGVMTTVTSGQDIDTTLLVEGWEAKTSRRDTTPTEITQTPGTIGVITTVTGGQGIDTTLLAEGWESKTSRRDTTPTEITQTPGTIGVTTTVTGGQDIDTTLLAEGWESKTRKDTTSAKVIQVPESTGATTPVIGGQVPKTTETISSPCNQVIDTTLTIKEWGTTTYRGDITPIRVTKASGIPGTITSVVSRKGTGTLRETTPIAGIQDRNTNLVAKGQKAEISRGDPTLVSITQLPAQVSSKNIQPPGSVRVTIPNTDVWILETARAADSIPEVQTSGAKVTSNIMVSKTRAETKTIVGTIRERRSTIRSTNRLTRGTVDTRTHLITTRNIPGIIRPSTMVRDSLREVTPGIYRQTLRTTRATASGADISPWFSGTIRKGKASALGGTAAIGRESHSEEPLKRIPGATLLIPPSNKPCMEILSPDQQRISQILIAFSTVLLPIVLLVLLLLLRKLRKRISLWTQKPTVGPRIQLTNFQDFSEMLSLKAQPLQEA
ncbi:high affinity immunoglobulin alpha and immunoglobulin mu Fc receptor [Sarcophilus harrisii]|uniref:high affinity immunoglobulin alpha and immunoglobulin mu Fc receptor n=1 Tax=Sarcophilus harrisii TaxID=9305 RepID=UPI001301D33E|nr:high affinity immunoglobulin alpha and immunoglobulin mu Fc receptor [Sarcophilus harrisii]